MALPARLATPAWVVAGAALCALVALLVLPRGQPAAPFRIPRTDLVPPAALARMADAPAPLRAIVVRGGQPTLGTAPAGVAADIARPAPPARLSIPTLNLDAPIDPVSATPGGVQIPAVGRAGWFDAGPRPGEPGRAVLIGHFDATNGPGLFALLPAVAPGTEVAITDARGAVHRFRIVGKAQIEKSKFPTNAVYGPADRPVLVLITCGGPWLGSSYRDNVLVYARGA